MCTSQGSAVGKSISFLERVEAHNFNIRRRNHGALKLVEFLR
jgi:hypothetical protein